MPLTREQILAKRERVIRTAEVPAMGGDVLLRKLTARERNAMLEEIPEDASASEGELYLLAACVCDEQGKPLLTTADVQALGEQEPEAIAALMDVAGPLNGFGAARGEIAKNSSAGPSAG